MVGSLPRFSFWFTTYQRVRVRLEPHIRYNTDVVLLGHSMGGILAAEVALKPSNTPATGQPFRLRILGTVNLDTPFLGLHPGVISAGITSLFRPASESPGQHPRKSSSAAGLDTASGSTQGSESPPVIGGDVQSQASVRSLTSPLSSPASEDPWFDPPFPNDVRLKERTGWSNVLHFLNKHSDNLAAASKQYIVSHLEFGSCLADYPALKNRCDRLRALEDVDELAGRDRPGYRRPVRRIRFVNFYTASTGRPKPPKALPGQTQDQDGYNKPMEIEMKEMSTDGGLRSAPLSPPATFGFAVDGQTSPDQSPDQLDQRPFTSPAPIQSPAPLEGSYTQDSSPEPLELQYIDAAPIDDDDYSPQAEIEIATSAEPVSGRPSTGLDLSSLEPALPPVPDMPVEPKPIDLTLYADKDARKIAEKEQKRLMKVYNQAMKDREIAIKDRKKLADKREKKARQELEKRLKAEQSKRLKEEREAEKRKHSGKAPESPGQQTPMSPMSTTFPPPPHPPPPPPKQENKPKKDRKFCMLPAKRGGKRDKCWVRVPMEGMDEVGAHCGLFFPGPQYEPLVQDVGSTIQGWLVDDAAKRIALGEGENY